MRQQGLYRKKLKHSHKKWNRELRKKFLAVQALNMRILLQNWKTIKKKKKKRHHTLIIYIYIYIDRERERERERYHTLNIYIYRQRERERERYHTLNIYIYIYIDR